MSGPRLFTAAGSRWIVRPPIGRFEDLLTNRLLAKSSVGATRTALRSCLTVSPYAQNPDASGNSGNMGYDPAFARNVQTMALTLKDAGTLPSQWVVENYGAGGTGNDIEQDGTSNSLNAIALYLARTLNPSKTATASPTAAGGQADQGMMDTAVMVSPVRAGVPLQPVGPTRIADVMGAGQMASQDRNSVDINGGTIINVTIQATGGSLENVSMSGACKIITSIAPILQAGVIIQSLNPNGGVFYINGDTDGGNTLWLTKPGGVPIDLRVDSIGANIRPTLVATTNLDVSGGFALNVTPGPDPDIYRRVYEDENGFLKVSAAPAPS